MQERCNMRQIERERQHMRSRMEESANKSAMFDPFRASETCSLFKRQRLKHKHLHMRQKTHQHHQHASPTHGKLQVNAPAVTCSSSSTKVASGAFWRRGRGSDPTSNLSLVRTGGSLAHSTAGRSALGGDREPRSMRQRSSGSGETQSRSL